MTRTARLTLWATAAAGLVAIVLIAIALSRSGAAGPDAGAAVTSSSSPTQTTATTAPPSPTESSTPSATTTTPTTSASPTQDAGQESSWSDGLQVLDPVTFSQKADFGTGVTVSLQSVTAVDGVGRLPGEKSGPSAAVTIAMHNGTDAPIDLDKVVVDLYAADGRVASALSQDPHAAPMSGLLAPGDDATGTYVLLLPDPSSTSVSITVSYLGTVPAAVFQGSVTP